MIVADKDFFDPEYRIPKKSLEKRGYSIKVANLSGGVSTGIESLIVKADIAIKDIREADYHSLILVGGYGVRALFDNPELIKVVQSFNNSGKIIGAQCYSPIILAQAGLLDHKKATCWYDAAAKLESYGITYTNKSIEKADNILTAQSGSVENIKLFTEAYIDLLENKNEINSKQNTKVNHTPAEFSFDIKEGQHPYVLSGNLSYYLYLPKGYSRSDKKWPLILFLHGLGDRGDNQNELVKVKTTGLPKYLEENSEFPAIVLSPQCPKTHYWPQLLDKIENLIKIIEANYFIDKNRIYLTGLSMGGHGSWHLGLRNPELFAAIVPIAGFYSFPYDDIPPNICDLKDVPIWVFHGAKDTDVPASRSKIMVEALKKCGSNVRFTLYPDAHHDSWTETYHNPELYIWMFRQKRIR